MLKKTALIAALAMPTLAFANPYLLAGAASGTADLSDVETTYGYGSGHTKDDSFTRALIGVGADITPNLGVEALYMTEGEVKLSEPSQQDNIKNSGFQFALLGKAPLTPQFSLFGKISANYLKIEDDFIYFGSGSFEDKNFHLGFGFGGRFQFNDQVGMTLALERIQVRDVEDPFGNKFDSDLDQASLALNFAF